MPVFVSFEWRAYRQTKGTSLLSRLFVEKSSTSASPSLPWSHRVKRVYLADGTMDEPCKEGPTRDLFKSPSDFLLFHGPQNVALSTFPIILPFSLSLLLPFIVHHCGERSRGIGRNRFVSRLARVCR